MKKRRLLLLLVCLAASVGFITTVTSCKNTDEPGQVEAEKFTVTFNDPEGGTATPTQTIVKGEKATEPTAPKRNGYTFDGWYAGDTKYDFTKPVTADILLVAHWTLIPVVEEGFTATLKYENGTANGSLKATKSGDSWYFTKPTDPTKADHTFDGWFTEAGDEFDFTKAVTADVVLVAHWTPNTPVEEGFTATLKYDNGAEDGTLEATKTGDDWFFTKPADPTKEDHTFDGWFTEDGDEFDFTKAVSADVVLVAHWTPNTPVEKGFTATLKYNNGAEDGTLESTKTGEDWLLTKPANPTKDYYEFDCWCSDEELKTPFEFKTALTEDITLYAKWKTAYDTVATTWDFKAGASIIQDNPGGNVVLTEEMTFQGKFVLGTDARFEISTASCINTQNKTFEFILSGDGNNNSVTFNVKWASSSSGSFKIVNKDTQKVVYESNILANGSAAYDAEVTDLPAGRYAVTSDGSLRFYKFIVTEKLAQSPIKGIEVNTTAIDKNVLLGRAFSTNGLAVSLVYENGRKDVIDLSKVTITVPQDFTSAAGVKTISVNYNNTYTETYTVNVCAISELVYYDYVLNSSRQTMNLQTLFPLNGTFNSNNLVVKAKCLLPGSTTDYVEFKLDSNEYTIRKPDLNIVGNKPVYLIYNRDMLISAEYEIEVVAVPNLVEETEVTVVVDPNADISTYRDYNVHTINQALQFLKLAQASNDAYKTISLMKNTTYHEKVEIDIPNVTLITGNLTEEDLRGAESVSTYEEAKAYYDLFAVIEFDALSGKLDPSETITHSTDGSATVSIRSNAEYFLAQTVTFKNHYNTNALYKESLTITTDSQAVAALVQADKAEFLGCMFTSYHDTLYAQVGRQFYKSCLIEGHTDYIFGYNSTALFNRCFIRSIGAGADPAVNSNYNNGGYVVATKGLSKSDSTDGIEYGYVFDECEFSADDATANGSVSIARGWDTNMRIMVMNCLIGAHISKEAYGEVTATEGSKNMNDRYGKMNDAPNADFLLEYNNSGEGAIVESLPNTCTVVTEEIASKFTMNDVFTPYNRNLNYVDSWKPITPKNATVTLKDENGEVLQTLNNISWYGSFLTKQMLDDAFVIPNGKAIEGFYSDQECTTKYDYNTALDVENIIYVKLINASVFTSKSYNFSELDDGDVDKSISLDGIITIVGASDRKLSVDAHSRTIQNADGKDVGVTKRLKTGGSTNASGRYITIDLSSYSGKFVIEVFAMTGSNSTARTGQLRKDSVSGTSIFVIDCPAVQNGDQPTKSSGTIDGGSIYYITADASINFYGINIKPAA